MADIQKAKRIRAEEQEMEIERNLREADLKAVLAKLDKDLGVLSERAASSHSEAMKHAQDLKYLRGRQKQLADSVQSHFVSFLCVLVRRVRVKVKSHAD